MEALSLPCPLSAPIVAPRDHIMPTTNMRQFRDPITTIEISRAAQHLNDLAAQISTPAPPLMPTGRTVTWVECETDSGTVVHMNAPDDADCLTFSHDATSNRWRLEWATSGVLLGEAATLLCLLRTTLTQADRLAIA
jgi:hypothetical protein